MPGALAFLGGVGLPELLVVLGLIVLVFGASRIPEVARSLGKGIREFKKATREPSEEADKAEEDKTGEEKP